jgi:hypothetical protein
MKYLTLAALLITTPAAAQTIDPHTGVTVPSEAQKTNALMRAYQINNNSMRLDGLMIDLSDDATITAAPVRTVPVSGKTTSSSSTPVTTLKKRSRRGRRS